MIEDDQEAEVIVALFGASERYEIREEFKGGFQHPSNKFEILWKSPKIRFLSYFHTFNMFYIGENVF